MRILFVAMTDSIHTVRWLRQLEGTGWDIHVFDSWHDEIHPELENVTVHNALRFGRPPHVRDSVKLRGKWWMPVRRLTLKGSYFLWPRWMDKARRLARVIEQVKPDIVHSLEIQHAGYIVRTAKDILGDRMPKWIVTNWGSDTYLYGRLDLHAPQIRRVLESSEYYDCECKRDVKVARSLGFDGEVFPVHPNSGGLRVDELEKLRQDGPVSSRRVIMLKGYQDVHGRALCGLRGIALAADVLKDYRIVVYSAGYEVHVAAELISKETGLSIEMLPFSEHEEMLELHGQARMSISVAISDGVSTSFLEALTMGSFPIQSYTACADEWITDGESGLIVEPEDPSAIAAAIRRAATDDALVERAAEINLRTARERLDYDRVRDDVIDAYGRVAAGKPLPEVIESERTRPAMTESEMSA